MIVARPRLPGQRLIIPREPTTLLAARPENPAPETVLAESQPVVAEPAASNPTSTGERAEPQRLVYRVKRGDTLSRSPGSSTRRSSRSNPGTARSAATQIKIGDRLTIFATRAAN